MNILQKYVTENPCYQAGRSIHVEGLMLHSVGCPQPNAEVFYRSWNRKDFSSSCVHAFIDGNTGDVWQTLPWNRRGWHCGSGKNGSGNNTHIGIEMCEPLSIRYISGSQFTCWNQEEARASVTRTYRSAVELFAMLCRRFDLSPMRDGVVISHKEGHENGIATDHGDPEHLWNGLNTGFSMKQFRKDVRDAMLQEASEDFQQTQSIQEKKVRPYLVRVERDNLYLRTGPGTDYDDLGFIPSGSYTIIAESDGTDASYHWGKLLSGAGWIALNFATRPGEGQKE